MELSAVALGQYEYMKKARRELHKLAEIGLDVDRTRSYVRQCLVLQGLKPKDCGGGLIVDIKGEEECNFIGFRADMDALPIEESRKNLGFNAKGKVMHACGHDGHMAMLLGLARALKTNPPKYRVRLIFQPGEEGYGGAARMVEAGAANGLTEVYALHLSPSYAAGEIATLEGVLFAGVCDFELILHGKSAHCASPSDGADAIRAALMLNDVLNELKGEDFLLHVGKIEGGIARNIVADSCKMSFSLRYFDEGVKDRVVCRLTDALLDIAKRTNVNHELHFSNDYYPLKNSAHCVSVIENVAECVKATAQFFGEDFSEFCNTTEGAMCWLGTCQQGFEAPLYSSMFGFDERVLVHGVELFLRLCKGKIDKGEDNV